MIPSEAASIAAAKAGELLDQAAEHLDDTVHVQSCVTLADAWTRLHLALATSSAAANLDQMFPGLR
ncbi:hypothetical protein SAMN05421874_12850 [Nonomuraea maritima]|uniref:Uncharacterized protein n=1 Tax=Nonomuraea maritima TaxID=683260 RepID=A0A1G9MI30_9ACTN|nr:hypothetical protein [Nonomuraea maritima]SDL73936.1 hypothetical protein SAMN05421874_12850 [Nonomuraea maritima]